MTITELHTKRLILLPVLLGAMGLTASPLDAQTGACCLGDASCVGTDAADCATLDGTFIGEGSNCATVTCKGGCCSGDAAKTCFETSRDECAAVSGLFRGPQTTCDATCPALLGTSFMYQGQLKRNGVPVNDSADVQVLLFPVAEGGAPMDLQDNFAVPVLNGLFTVELDFGAEAFAGSERWLEIRVRVPHDPTDAAPFEALSPRQRVRATPYASFARTSQRPFRQEGANAVFEGGNVGIGTTGPSAPLHVETDTAERAVFGHHTATSLTRFGLAGQSDSTGGRGVFGLATSETGLNTGVWGQTASTSGRGVLGIAAASSGTTRGVHAQSNSTEGTGVYGFALAGSGTTVGVHGEVNSPDGYAGFFEGGRNYFEGNVGIGTSAPRSLLQVGEGDEAEIRLGLDPQLLLGRDVAKSKFRIQLTGTGFTNRVLQLGRDDQAHGLSLMGNVGVGTTSSGAKLHVRSDADLIDGPVTQSDDLVVESADAVLGLYSDDAGPTGSAISFKEINPQGPLNDHWALYRETNSVGAALRFTYGTNKDYALNPAVVELAPGLGNDSVKLPGSAVSAFEMLNEPGVARRADDSITSVSGESSVVLASRSITCPASGFILALGETTLTNLDDFFAQSIFLAIERPGPDERREIRIEPPAGRLSTHVSMTALFAVDAGTHDFDLRAIRQFSGETINASDPSLTLIYLPTAYGGANVEQAP